MVTFHWPLILPWAVGPHRSIVKMTVLETGSHISDSIAGLSVGTTRNVETKEVTQYHAGTYLSRYV